VPSTLTGVTNEDCGVTLLQLPTAVFRLRGLGFGLRLSLVSRTRTVVFLFTHTLKVFTVNTLKGCVGVCVVCFTHPKGVYGTHP